MNLLRRSATAALVALVLARVDVPNAHATPIDWVTVGDPGNAADTTTYGAVGYEYQIMKFEWTNSQYVEFLNAVDPDGTNPDSIYNSTMGSNARGGITNTGTTSGSRYAFKTNMGDKPVNYLSWWDAARVANWLQAGGTNSPTSISGSAVINSGAYTLSGATSGTAPAKNVGAQYWVPTENEWYKAAYYKGSGTNAGYWQYATQVTGTAPIAVGATSVGTGTSGGVSPVISGNFANYNLGAVWSGQTGNVTTVGSKRGPECVRCLRHEREREGMERSGWQCRLASWAAGRRLGHHQREQRVAHRQDRDQPVERSQLLRFSSRKSGCRA